MSGEGLAEWRHRGTKGEDACSVAGPMVF